MVRKTEDDCKAWTKVQIDGAIQAANDYPDLVDRIIVGNEDIEDDQYTDGAAMRQRVADDVTYIKGRLFPLVSNAKVGTAQMWAPVKQ